jgi:uncharacterized protein (TIGR02118 family)
MQRPLLAFAALTLVAACSKPAPPQQQRTAASGPQWVIVVLYHQPKDTAAFETYYLGTHLPLAASVQQEIGFTRAVFVKFTHNLDGSRPAYYRKAELWFDSEAALQKGIATAGFKKIGDDFKNFVTGGLTALVSVESPK